MIQSRVIAAVRALIGFSGLIVISLICKSLQSAFHLRLPGPVIGLALLAVVLLLLQRWSHRIAHQANLHLMPISKTLLRYMGLLFVPAGVGIVTQGDVIRKQWPAITIAVVGSTVIGLAATAWTAQQFSKRTKP